MTPDPRQAPPPAPILPRWAIEILGLALIVGGLITLTWIACTVSWRLGAAVVCVLAVVAGLALTTSREEQT